MNILQITPRFPYPLKDGGALGYYNFTKGYHDAGCTVTLASLNTSKHFVNYEELPNEIKSLAEIHLTFIDNRVKPIDAFLNLFTNKSYNISRFISTEFENALIDLCQKKTFDVIVFESIFVSPYLDVIRKYSNAICVLREHNVEYEIWQGLAENESNIFKKAYLKLLAYRLKKFEIKQLNLFDCVTTVTKNDENEFRKLGCNKPIFTSATGVDLNRLQIDNSEIEMPSLFHIGSMDWLPNCEALKWFIENVWEHIHLKYPELKFYIAGRNMPSVFFEYNNRKNIKIIGEVEDALRFMQQKAIMVVPLFSGSGIRIKILEGMALGKCIVSTSLGSQGIDATDGKEIYEAETANDFLTKIDFLLQNQNLISETGFAARELIKEKYDTKLIIERTLNFYKSIKK